MGLLPLDVTVSPFYTIFFTYSGHRIFPNPSFYLQTFIAPTPKIKDPIYIVLVVASCVEGITLLCLVTLRIMIALRSRHRYLFAPFVPPDGASQERQNEPKSRIMAGWLHGIKYVTRVIGSRIASSLLTSHYHASRPSMLI